DGKAIDIRPVAHPHSMKWSGNDGEFVEIIFDGTDSLRVRGTGLDLKLIPYQRTEVYSTEAEKGKGRFATFNILPMQRKFQIQCLGGDMRWRSQRENETGKEFDVELTIAGQNWEIAIDMFLTVWQARDRRSFTSCHEDVKAEFIQWVKNTPMSDVAYQNARGLAAYITWSAVVKPHGLLKRPTMLMSKNYMAKVWSWDHCFNALALAPAHPQLAWDQMLVMVDEQDEFGCYPDAYNDTSLIFNYTKPPVHGWTIQELIKRLDPSSDDPRLQTLFTSLEKWTDFWLNHRRLPDAELAHYLHGYDSGWDNCTMFDETVPVIGPDLNIFLIIQMDSLSEIAALMDDKDKSLFWKIKADHMYDALIEELWDGTKFIAKGAIRGEIITSDCLIYCLPILLGKRLPSDIREKLVTSIARFKTPHGLATEHPDSDKFMDDGYWRGPIWGPSTYLIFSGLMRSGYPDLAYDIAARFCNMCRDNNFAENHHAITGKALRDPGFTWTASTFLLMAEQLSRQT
ncbi:MAG TPA: glycogen debranching protein, partial [Sphingomonadales bacterium]|nr:glycogen debranching protein [Sphingomonadales bacterium]